MRGHQSAVIIDQFHPVMTSSKWDSCLENIIILSVSPVEMRLLVNSLSEEHVCNEEILSSVES